MPPLTIIDISTILKKIDLLVMNKLSQLNPIKTHLNHPPHPRPTRISLAHDGFTERRYQWLSTVPRPRSTTVMVRNIPPMYRSDSALKGYFDRVPWMLMGSERVLVVIKQQSGHGCCLSLSGEVIRSHV